MQRVIKNFKSDFFVSFDKTRIYYEISGEKSFKETIVFIHGLGGNLTAWDPQRLFFEKLGYTTIAIDIRGHGFSDRPKNRKKYTPEIMTQDVLLFLNKHKIKNYILVGHSFGGIIALLLADFYKIKPQTLILISATYEFPISSKLIWFSKIINFSSDVINHLPFTLGKPGHMPLYKFKGTRDLSPRRIINDLFYTTAQSYISVFSNLFLFKNKEMLKNITCPTLIIHGEKDIFVSRRIAMNLHEDIKKSELVFVPSGNHFLVINNPDELTDIMDKYLQQELNTAINN
jgi:pimeloyl-ACP methyl ester carboxylesterase